MLRLIIFLLCFVSSVNVSASTSADSLTKLRFQNLAKKMKLKSPNLATGEYEIRIWHNVGLLFGAAQWLYRLQKQTDNFRVTGYRIRSDARGFRGFTRSKPKRLVTDSLWQKLLANDILTLPDEKIIHNELFPKPQKDSTWNVIEADGSVSVKAKRRNDTGFLITDGEIYYFELFSANRYRNSSYSNPELYLKHKPKSSELRKVVTILNDLDNLFQSSN